jgi:hypothetical protein
MKVIHALKTTPDPCSCLKVRASGPRLTLRGGNHCTLHQHAVWGRFRTRPYRCGDGHRIGETMEVPEDTSLVSHQN